jgi:pSer/pThr/pTyr-binding forkhead associated (FHA) protein
MTKKIFLKFKVILGEGRKETTLDVTADRFFAGRSPDCKVVLQGAKISRQHIEVWHDQGILYIKDLDTSNGTWLEATKLVPQQPYPIVNGVKINCAGEKFFKVEAEYREEKIEVPPEDLPDIDSKTIIQALNPEKSFHQIQAAEKKAEEIVAAARADSLKLIDQARDEVKNIHTEWKQRGEALFKQAEEKARKMLQQVEQSNQERLEQAKIETESIKKEAFNEGKYQLELERKKILAEAEESASTLLSRTESSVREIEVFKQERIEELKVVSEKLDHVRYDYEKKEQALASIQKRMEALVETQNQIVQEKELLQLKTADLNDQLGQIASKQQEVDAKVALAHGALTRANSEASKIQNETEEKNKRKIELFESEFKSKVETRELEFQAFKREQEDLLYKQRQFEEKRTAQMIKDAEEAASALKSEQSKHIIKALRDYFSKILETTEASPRSLDNVLVGEIVDIVGRGLNNELNLQEAELKGLMEYNPYSAVKQKKYWTKFAAVASFIVVFGLTYMIKPHWFSAISRKFVSSVTLMDTEDREKIKKSQEMLIYNSKFHPLQDEIFKSTYFENVLYLQFYLDFEKNEEYQKKWIVSANKLLLTKIGANETLVARFIADEGNLINELSHLSEQIDGESPQKGIDKLIAKEKEFNEKSDYLGETERKDLKSIKQNLYSQYLETIRSPASK